MFDTQCIEFVVCQNICRNLSATLQKCAQHVLRFPDLLFSSTRLVELLLWLAHINQDWTLQLGSGNVVGNSFVLFDVSIVIPHGQFHRGNRGHTQNTGFPWVKSHFPVGKRSSGTATIDSRKLNFRYMLSNCKQTWSFVYLQTYKCNTCSPIVFI